MKHTVLALLMAATPLGTGGAQAIPLAFARPDSSVRAQLDTDWWARAEQGTEWAYCVTEWGASRTADGDTVFFAQKIVPAPTAASSTTTMTYGCNDRQGRPLPTIHAHPSGSCSPSRADIETAIARGADFEMIVCGPGITNGYVAKQFRRQGH